jgi:hypothetical protein
VLSEFEESSAACISDMLRQFSNGQNLDAIRMAEKFILHVEVLFATIDDVDFQFAQLSLKGTHILGVKPSDPDYPLSQGCRMSGKRVCYVAKQWICLLCSRTPKKLGHGGWA